MLPKQTDEKEYILKENWKVLQITGARNNPATRKQHLLNICRISTGRKMLSNNNEKVS